MNRDFVEMLSALTETEAEFLVVGAHALAAHGVPRATGDLDIWVKGSGDNAERVLSALEKFGAPLIDLTISDLTTPGTVYQIGVPPSRIGILISISGVTFEQVWAGRLTVKIEGITVPILGKGDFIVNKRAVGRPKDFSDLELLAEADRQS
jgi:hypothetical protein